MPLIRIRMAKPKPTKEIQDKIAAEMAEVWVRNLGKNPARIVINFEYDEVENFYVGMEEALKKKES